jgi:hypothetical protein
VEGRDFASDPSKQTCRQTGETTIIKIRESFYVLFVDLQYLFVGQWPMISTLLLLFVFLAFHTLLPTTINK